MSNNMEHEHKVKVEEVFINMGCVKEELKEETLDFEGNNGVEIDQYKVEAVGVKYENMSEEHSDTNQGNGNKFSGLVDENVVVDETIIKFEEIKEENIDFKATYSENLYCNKCNGNYQGYCLNCSSLSHILNHISPDLNLESDTIPRTILEIRDISMRKGVFALRTLPENVIFGPFRGLSAIDTTNGNRWKIKKLKFANDKNGNWMKYVICAGNQFSTNLNIFQFNRYLYFETNREIQEGEELVMCFGKEVELDNEEESYFGPVKKEEFPKIVACTLCCLGFRLESCLMEHKSKCPHEESKENFEDFEIVECQCCKVWLEKQEHLKHHMRCCLDHYNRLYHNISDFQRNPSDEIDETQGNDEISVAIDENTSYLTVTEVTHSKYPDGIEKANKKGCFSEKKHKCSECSYQTNRKSNLKLHLYTHADIKPFECEICKKRFTQRGTLKLHIENQHSNTSEKEYKCPECSYQTNYKSNLKNHLNTHNDIKSLIQNKHSNTNEKEYKCSQCLYQTKRKSHLKRHLSIHNDIKPFQCDICKKGFGQKGNLILHIENIHSNTSEREYKCTECSYQTNRKDSLKRHLNAHNDIRPFECDICKMRFSQKNHLKQHIIAKHSNTSEKEYKCSDCSYQTNHKTSLKEHLDTHNDIKPFQCDICQKRYNHTSSLNKHIRNHH